MAFQLYRSAEIVFNRIASCTNFSQLHRRRLCTASRDYLPPRETRSSIRRKKDSPLLREITWKEINMRGSPKKMNLVARLIRRMDVSEALDQLRFLNKRRSHDVMKILKSAIKKAEDHHGLQKEELHVAVAEVGKGPYEKRVNIHGRGRSGIRLLKTTHLRVVLREKSKDSGVFNKGPKNAQLSERPEISIDS